MIAELPGMSTPLAEVQHAATRAGKRVVIYALPDDRDALRSALEQGLELSPLDARIRVRHLPGLLPETLSAEQADALVDAMHRLGIEAEAIDPHDCPNLSHGATVHHVRSTDQALEIVANRGTVAEGIAWPRVELISIADVPLDAVHHFVPPQTVMVRSAPRKTDAEIATSVRGAEMWIVCRDPFRAFRIDHREMNYESLGAAKSESATVNFRHFAEELVRRATSATLTPTTQAFLGNSMQGYRLESAARHRALVQFYDLVSRRVRVLRQSGRPTPRLHCLQAVLAANPTLQACQFAECHQTLLQELDDLQAWIREADEYGDPQFGQMGDRVTTLERYLAEHFALEEEGGYMAEPLAAAPQFAARVAELQAEHPRVLSALRNLGQKLKDCPAPFNCWSDARNELQGALDVLSRHEHAENEIWQLAFERDVGPGD